MLGGREGKDSREAQSSTVSFNLAVDGFKRNKVGRYEKTKISSDWKSIY